MLNQDGMKALIDFKVIEIVDNKDLHPALLGVNQVFEYDAVLIFNKHSMPFEATCTSSFGPSVRGEISRTHIVEGYNQQHC